MVQRLFNLDKWYTLEEGGAIWLNSPKTRVVRLEVKSGSPVVLFGIDQEDREHMLALVNGRDTIEFVHSGAIRLAATGGSIDVYTVDGEDISVVIPDAESFTKIMERRPRNPEFEAIAQRLMANMERRFAQQSHELARVVAARDAAKPVQPKAKGVPGDAGQEPAQAGEPGSSGSQS